MNKKALIIIIAIITVLCLSGALIGCYYSKLTTSQNNNNNNQNENNNQSENNNQNESNNQEDTIDNKQNNENGNQNAENNDVKNGDNTIEENQNYKEILTLTTQKVNNKNFSDYKELNLNTKEKTYKQIDENLVTFDKDINELIDYAKECYEGGTDKDIKVSYKNNTLTVTYKNKTQTINNIKKINAFYDGDGNGMGFKFIVFDDNNIWYMDTTIEKYNSFVKFDSDYIDFIVLVVNSGIDAPELLYLVKNKKGEYFDIQTFQKYDENIYKGFPDRLNIRTDYSVYIGSAKSPIVFKIGLYNYYLDEINFFISEDNYIYNKNLDKAYAYKVKKVLYKKYGDDQDEFKLCIVFEDGTYYESDTENYKKIEPWILKNINID